MTSVESDIASPNAVANSKCRSSLCGRIPGFDRLDDFEPFELRVTKCERLALARMLMGGAELFRLGPY